MRDIFDPAPKQFDEVINPTWLTAVLSHRWPDAKVHDVKVVETLVTQATKVRLSLSVTGSGPNIPTEICIKGILTPTGAPSTASVVETMFYRDSATQLPVRVPNCIHASLNEAGDNGILVMRDLVHEGATFCSALTPFSLAETRQTLEQLALLHSATWQGSANFEQTPIPRFLDQIGSAPIMPLGRLQEMLDGPKGDQLASPVKDAARLQKGIQALAAQIRTRPSCFVHGDAHAGNIYRQTNATGNAEFGMVDWQILQKGEWAQDIAYHIAAVLTPEDRATHERTLLDHYLGRLKALGGPDLDREDAWSRYRSAMIYGFYLWSITQKVEPEITNLFVHRLGTAVAELDSYSVVDV